MRSSISSSNSLERVIPKQQWGKLAVSSFIIALLLTLGWEMYWRSKGYAPTLNDNKDLWSLTREKVNTHPSRTVLIGASRMLFDFDMQVWKEKYNELPLQLATVGTNPSIYLDHLANESNFKGTLLLGITPPLFFVPEGMPVDNPKSNIDFYNKFSPAQRISYYLGLVLDRNLAFVEQEDIPLTKIFEDLPIANRPKAKVGPKLPPYFMSIDENRQGRMHLRKGHEQVILDRIAKGWVPLFTPPPPPPMFTPEQFKKMFMEHVNKTIVKAKENVSKIQARGGKVILIRFPSTGKVRELENKFAPRVAFWDRLATEIGANQSIHFEDHQELQGFDCPEQSHLRASDATEFTKRLLRKLH